MRALILDILIGTPDWYSGPGCIDSVGDSVGCTFTVDMRTRDLMSERNDVRCTKDTMGVHAWLGALPADSFPYMCIICAHAGAWG
eukprot:1158326-Pelagomonas_calceolata.AAC.13